MVVCMCTTRKPIIYLFIKIAQITLVISINHMHELTTNKYCSIIRTG